MTIGESLYAVWLYDRQVGLIHRRGDHTRFDLDESYRVDPERPVLGLRFEEDLTATHAAALRLAPWFSNLLPEGQLREWIAADRGVSPAREMELLAQVGHDLPGAVRVLPAGEVPGGQDWTMTDAAKGTEPDGRVPGWRFSLAGIALKFSMVGTGDRLTLPTHGEGGDWIVKLPDQRHADVPRNEFAMMSLAAAVGIDVPPVQIVHRDQLDGLPSRVWPDAEEWAYAVRRFDRDGERRGVHIEDLAQVRNFYAEDKYRGSFETVAALVYRGNDVAALREFARRLAFSVLISNGDAHLKNWSLIYRDRRTPTLSPAYDLVATAPYRRASDGRETLALKFNGSRRFELVTLAGFDRLQRRLDAAGASLADCAADLIREVETRWPDHADVLRENRTLVDTITESIRLRARSLRRVGAVSA
ncbi:MAG TPA: HipA domain-containing protein [Mycobacteriales bacterium]|nr:HipA domain-containing protein [Mycobacteriales bacterium]